jgi:hypothetical protein
VSTHTASAPLDGKRTTDLEGVQDRRKANMAGRIRQSIFLIGTYKLKLWSIHPGYSSG